MGAILVVTRSLSGSSRACGHPAHPSGSSEHLGSTPGSSSRPGCRSSSPRKDLIVITHKHRDQSAKIYKIAQITKPTLTGRA